MVLARLHADVLSAGLRGVEEQIYQHAFPLRGVALQAKIGIDLIGELDFGTVGALQVIAAELSCIFDHGSELCSGAIALEDAVHNSLAAIDAALQGMCELLPFGIVFQKLRALADGLKDIVQIVNQTFEREISNIHTYSPAARRSVSKNSGKDTEAAPASSIAQGPSAIRAATEKAMAIR